MCIRRHRVRVVYTYIHFSTPIENKRLHKPTPPLHSLNHTNEMNSYNKKKICFRFRRENGKCPCLFLIFFCFCSTFHLVFSHRYIVAVDAANTLPTISGRMHCVTNWQMVHALSVCVLTYGQITSGQCHRVRVQFSKCFQMFSSILNSMFGFQFPFFPLLCWFSRFKNQKFNVKLNVHIYLHKITLM